MSEEKLIKDNISVDGLASWTRTLEEAVAFAVKVNRIFKKSPPETKRMALKIRSSNPRKTRYQALI